PYQGRDAAMAPPMIAPVANPTPGPHPRPRHPPPQRRNCTVSTEGVVAFCKLEGWLSGAAAAGPPSHGALPAISTSARIFEVFAMTELPFLVHASSSAW